MIPKHIRNLILAFSAIAFITPLVSGCGSKTNEPEPKLVTKKELEEKKANAKNDPRSQQRMGARSGERGGGRAGGRGAGRGR